MREQKIMMEQVRQIMLNPQPLGWKQAVEMGMIDFCQYENACEQEEALPQFLDSQFETMSKIFFIRLIVHILGHIKN